VSDDDAPRAPVKRRWKLGPKTTAAVVVALAFVVGGLAGASIFQEMHEPRGGRPRLIPGMRFTRAPIEEAEEGLEPGQASRHALARFAKALDLSPAQAAAVDTIARREFEEASTIREQTWPRMQAVLDATRSRIDSVLTPEQRTRYHEMLARSEERQRREQATRDSAERASDAATHRRP
jgi:hypothetical protein